MKTREHFNPRAPCGARLRCHINDTVPRRIFQPTRPLRGATGRYELLQPTFEISTHAPLAGRDAPPVAGALFVLISTHAPLAGRD